MTEVMVGTVASPSMRNEGWKTLQSWFLGKSESVKISKFVSCSRTDPEIWASEGCKLYQDKLWKSLRYYEASRPF